MLYAEKENTEIGRYPMGPTIIIIDNWKEWVFSVYSQDWPSNKEMIFLDHNAMLIQKSE